MMGKSRYADKRLRRRAIPGHGIGDDYFREAEIGRFAAKSICSKGELG
jgi:hypothetical protein